MLRCGNALKTFTVPIVIVVDADGVCDRAGANFSGGTDKGVSDNRRSETIDRITSSENIRDIHTLPIIENDGRITLL